MERVRKLMFILFSFTLFFSFSLVSAVTWTTDTQYKNTNRSDFWDTLDTPADINAGDITDDNTYVQVAGDTMTGALKFSGVTSPAINISQGNDDMGWWVQGYDDRSNKYLRGYVSSTGVGNLDTSSNYLMRIANSAKVLIDSSTFQVYNGVDFMLGSANTGWGRFTQTVDNTQLPNFTLAYDIKGGSNTPFIYIDNQGNVDILEGNLNVTKNVTASYYFGDGSQLTNLPAPTDIWVNESGDYMTGFLNITGSVSVLNDGHNNPLLDFDSYTNNYKGDDAIVYGARLGLRLPDPFNDSTVSTTYYGIENLNYFEKQGNYTTGIVNNFKYGINNRVYASTKPIGTPFVYTDAVYGIYNYVSGTDEIKVSTFTNPDNYKYGSYNQIYNTERHNSAGEHMDFADYGVYSNVISQGSAIAGTHSRTAYGLYTTVNVLDTTAEEYGYGLYIEAVGSGGTLYGIWDNSGRDWALDKDNQKIFFGEGQDASIFFSSSTNDLTLNGREVGQGSVQYWGGLECDTCHSYSSGSGYSSVALGSYTNASNYGSVAIGFGGGVMIQSTGYGSVAIGNTGAGSSSGKMYSTGEGSVAMGSAIGTGGPFGGLINSTGTGSVAIGYSDWSARGLQSTGTGSVAIGEDVQATNTNTMSFGRDFGNSVQDSFAVGFGDKTLSIVDNNVGVIGNLNVTGNINITGCLEYNNGGARATLGTCV